MNTSNKNIFFALILLLAPLFTLAQSATKKDTMTVLGSCGQCKTRIEEAAYVKGVKHAEWNKKTKVLTLVYNPKKTSLSKVETAVNKVGHDTAHSKAEDKEYNKLPSCCAYRTGTCDHD